MTRLTTAPHLIIGPDPVRRVPITADTPIDRLIDREWLVTNGLGGYATGTIAGAATRRYHGVLIAALPNPERRGTLVADTEPGGYRFDIRLQGDRETVFFDV